MQGLPFVVAICATAIELSSYSVYVRDILLRGARPSRASWIVWTPLCWLTVASNWQAGADLTLIKLTTMCAGVTIVALLALRFGTGGWSPLDRLCMALTALGVAAWIQTSEPVAGLALFILADLAAAVPTLVDAARQPGKDSRAAWILAFAAATLNLGAVQAGHWTASWSGFGVWGFNVYLVLLNGAVAGLLLRPILQARCRALVRAGRPRLGYS